MFIIIPHFIKRNFICIKPFWRHFFCFFFYSFIRIYYKNMNKMIKFFFIWKSVKYFSSIIDSSNDICLRKPLFIGHNPFHL